MQLPIFLTLAKSLRTENYRFLKPLQKQTEGQRKKRKEKKSRRIIQKMLMQWLSSVGSKTINIFVSLLSFLIFFLRSIECSYNHTKKNKMGRERKTVRHLERKLSRERGREVLALHQAQDDMTVTYRHPRSRHPEHGVPCLVHPGTF